MESGGETALATIISVAYACLIPSLWLQYATASDQDWKAWETGYACEWLNVQVPGTLRFLCRILDL